MEDDEERLECIRSIAEARQTFAKSSKKLAKKLAKAEVRCLEKTRMKCKEDIPINVEDMQEKLVNINELLTSMKDIDDKQLRQIKQNEIFFKLKNAPTYHILKKL